jgi:hypothetical protein
LRSGGRGSAPRAWYRDCWRCSAVPSGFERGGVDSSSCTTAIAVGVRSTLCCRLPCQAATACRPLARFIVEAAVVCRGDQSPCTQPIHRHAQSAHSCPTSSERLMLSCSVHSCSVRRAVHHAARHRTPTHPPSQPLGRGCGYARCTRGFTLPITRALHVRAYV